MDALNITTAFRGLIADQLAEIHTSLPVRVTGVNYGAKTVTLEAIVKNSRSDEDVISYPTFYDVPFMINGGGDARISFPIRAGDIGTVLFAERDVSNAMQTNGDSASTSTLIAPCGLYPITFIPKIATATDSSESVDPNNIVISNNKQTYGSFSPDGNISIYNAQGMKIDITPGGITVNAPGKPITVTDGSGTLTISNGKMTYTGSEINLNGLKIDSNGMMTDGRGIGFHDHTHLVENIETGNGSRETNPPTGE